MAFDPLAPLRFGIRIGIGVLRFELRVVEHLLGLDGEEPFAAETPPPPPVRPEPEPVPEADVVPLARIDEPEPTDAEPDEPVHVDTEPELVAEFAEPGAEEGAGAEIRVDEPWPGYRTMQAPDVRDRVRVAGREELAVIQLYETTNRRRRTVLEAVERRMRELANAPASR